MTRMGDRRSVKHGSGKKRKRKRTLGKSRSKWEGNNKFIYSECDVRTWTGLIWLGIGTGGRQL